MRATDSGFFQLVLNGGLGNQLFGYAAGRSIESITGLKCHFIAPGIKDRKLELDNFGIECLERAPVQESPFFRIFANKIYDRLFPAKFRFTETSFRFDPRFYINTDGKTLRGYFQSHLYSQNIASELLKLPSQHVPFSNQFTALEKEWGNSRFIAVHIRRGDYIGKENYHGLVSVEYLAEARSRVLELKPDAKFVVFSDSIEIARSDFPFAEKYISGLDLAKPSENLLLMARMGGLIGSNSSLSWWVGFLNQHTEMNFFPDPWFANSQLDTQDLLPPSWKTIPSGIQSMKQRL